MKIGTAMCIVGLAGIAAYLVVSGHAAVLGYLALGLFFLFLFLAGG